MFFRCVSKDCESYPSAPRGFKVVAEQADDCCYRYRVVEDGCDVTACSVSPPVCEYFEDLQFFATDEKQCCGTYACACNPTKCSASDSFCPIGTVKTFVNKNACCPVTKCVVDSGLSENVHESAAGMFFGPTFTSMVMGGHSRNAVPTVDLGSSLSSEAVAEAGSSSDTRVKSGVDDTYSTATLMMKNLMGSASSASSAGVALFSDYGSYAAGRYQALSDNYAKALLRVGVPAGFCSGVSDYSSCPSTCASDQVCDGRSCVYPKDCPCFRNDLRRTVRNWLSVYIVFTMSFPMRS